MALGPAKWQLWRGWSPLNPYDGGWNSGKLCNQQVWQVRHWDHTCCWTYLCCSPTTNFAWEEAKEYSTGEIPVIVQDFWACFLAQQIFRTHWAYACYLPNSQICSSLCLTCIVHNWELSLTIILNYSLRQATYYFILMARRLLERQRAAAAQEEEISLQLA